MRKNGNGKSGSDAGVIALIAGAGAVGVLATMLAVSGTRGPAAPAERIEARERAVVVAEMAARMAEASARASEAREGPEARRVEIRSSASVSVAPVVYVDGVRVEGGPEKALEGIEPERIERVEIVSNRRRDGEARNGEIRIFTKGSS